MRLLPLLVGMEHAGVPIDAGELGRVGALLSAEAEQVEEQCQALAGTPFNVASSKQVGDRKQGIERYTGPGEEWTLATGQ